MRSFTSASLRLLSVGVPLFLAGGLCWIVMLEPDARAFFFGRGVAFLPLVVFVALAFTLLGSRLILGYLVASTSYQPDDLVPEYPHEKYRWRDRILHRREERMRLELELEIKRQEHQLQAHGLRMQVLLQEQEQRNQSRKLEEDEHEEVRFRELRDNISKIEQEERIQAEKVRLENETRKAIVMGKRDLEQWEMENQIMLFDVRKSLLHNKFLLDKAEIEFDMSLRQEKVRQELEVLTLEQQVREKRNSLRELNS